jgi:hypothetical protein
MFIAVKKMSHAISYTRTSPLSSTVLLQPLYSLVLHPRSWDVHGIKHDSNQFANTLEDTISSEGLLIYYSVTEAKLSLAIRLKTSFKHFVLISGKVNHTSTTIYNAERRYQTIRTLLIASSIVLGHPCTYGYSAYSMFATY